MKADLMDRARDIEGTIRHEEIDAALVQRRLDAEWPTDSFADARDVAEGCGWPPTRAKRDTGGHGDGLDEFIEGHRCGAGQDIRAILRPVPHPHSGSVRRRDRRCTSGGSAPGRDQSSQSDRSPPSGTAAESACPLGRKCRSVV